MGRGCPLFSKEGCLINPAAARLPCSFSSYRKLPKMFRKVGGSQGIVG